MQIELEWRVVGSTAGTLSDIWQLTVRALTHPHVPCQR